MGAANTRKATADGTPRTSIYSSASPISSWSAILIPASTIFARLSFTRRSCGNILGHFHAVGIALHHLGTAQNEEFIDVDAVDIESAGSFDNARAYLLELHFIA